MGNQIESRINDEISVYLKKFFIIFLNELQDEMKTNYSTMYFDMLHVDICE